VYSRVASHVLGDWNACGEDDDDDIYDDDDDDDDDDIYDDDDDDDDASYRYSSMHGDSHRAHQYSIT